MPTPAPTSTVSRQGIKRVHIELNPGAVVRDHDIGFSRFLYVGATADYDAGTGTLQGDATLGESVYLRIEEGDPFRIGIGMFVRLSAGFNHIGYAYHAFTPAGSANSTIKIFDLLCGEDPDGCIIAPQAWGLVTWTKQVPSGIPGL